LSFRNNIPRVTKITFGVFKFLFGVIVNTFGETISIYNIGCQSPVLVASKGRTQVEFVTDNDEDFITYQLMVFDNGQTTIDVIAREREPISYSGELVW